MFNLIWPDLSLSLNRLKRHGSVMRRPAKHRLSQRSKRDFLVQEHLILRQELILRNVLGQDFVCDEITTVESEEEVAEPGVWSAFERLEDRVQQEFTKVVYAV